MSTDFEDPPVQTASALVTGILGDLQTLVQQQFLLTRRELEAEMRQRAAAVIVFGLGLVVFFLDAIIICLMLAHLLHWLTSAQGSDPAWLPLWACYAVVAGTLFGVGGLLSIVGRAKFKSVESTPETADITPSQE